MKDNILYKVIRPFFVLYMNIVYKPKIIFKEEINDNGSLIIVSNHKNNLDFISMGLVTKRSICFLAKEELFHGILKPILNLFGMIPVNRRIKDKSVLINAKNKLDKNRVIGIFPEGTFNKTKNLLAPFKIGAVKLSRDCNVRILPIAIIGEYKRGNLKIIVDKSYYVKSDCLDIENDRLYKKIEKLIKEEG
ncbi:MAG: lysophospholipid acyltransferase family protein [bacterium]|nr:lysophospholipid acyltransferase family protein [bacterium]